MSKLDVLELTAARGEVDSEDVADAFGLSVPAAAMALLRLHRQGKLRRQRVVTEGRTPGFYLPDFGCRCGTPGMGEQPVSGARPGRILG